MSRYDWFRRRIAPIAFVLAIALIARDSCENDRRTHTTVELAFGAAEPRVRAVDVEVVVDGAGDPGAEPIARFHRAALPDRRIGPCRFVVALPGDAGELRIDVDLGPEHRHLTRRFHAVEGATLRIAVTDDDLRAAQR